MNKLTEEDLETYKEHHLTVGKLKEIIYKMPSDAIVLIERVEDFYYEKQNWGVFLKENMTTDFLKKQNVDEDEIEKSLSQYTPAFASFEDGNKLFIKLHY